jgi:hypothetical protein
MTYKKRLVFLLTLIGLMSLAYTGSIVFSYDRGNIRSASYVWLDSGDAGRINRIVLNNEREEFEFTKRGNLWFVSHNGNEYPARQQRIEDFLTTFTARSAWPVRSASAIAHERFGLGENASRVTILSDFYVLLDVLIGNYDITGREVYLRRAGQEEVRSGNSFIQTYITNSVESWFNYRFIPESEGGNVTSSDIQRVSVFTGTGTQTFSRRNRGWDVSGIVAGNQNNNMIEMYVTDILNTQGINFVDNVSINDPMFGHRRITLEFGNGRIVTMRFSQSNDEGICLAHVEGMEYVYSIPMWVVDRIFRDTISFELQ